MNIIVEISKQSKKWKLQPQINDQFFTESVLATLAQHPNFQNIKEIELSILLTDDAEIKELNKQFRKKDKATNVLSFPDNEASDLESIEFMNDKDYIYLGDIAFGYDIINSEALNKDISFQDHFRHLCVHAILHLIGYDHEEELDAEIMESMEITILKQFDIKSPY